MSEDNYKSCDNCYYENFDPLAYPCAMCTMGYERNNKWVAKQEEKKEDRICGYMLDRLTTFALACWDAGITNEQLGEIDFNLQWAFAIAQTQHEKALRQALERSLVEIINAKAEEETP